MDPEEQTSACLLCASATLWLNPLPGTSSKKVYHRDAEAQRRRTERRGGEALNQSAHRSTLKSAPHGSGITTLKKAMALGLGRFWLKSWFADCSFLLHHFRWSRNFTSPS